MSISNELKFNLQGFGICDVALTKLEIVFGKHNHIQAHQFKNQLIDLNVNDFSCIEDFF